jgi:hypothetical protein
MVLGLTIDQALHIDEKLTAFERDYKERMEAAASLIAATSTGGIAWPPDIPRPQADRDRFSDPQDKVAFDLTALALAFALLHEFSHVKLLAEKAQPDTLPEEELACDVWARDFMIAKLAAYARAHGHSYEEVGQKRAMALALAVTIIHAITPTAAQWGTRSTRLCQIGSKRSSLASTCRRTRGSVSSRRAFSSASCVRSIAPSTSQAEHYKPLPRR